MQTIFIAADHAGVDLKSELIRTLKNYKWEDLGPATSDRVDYPDYAVKCAEAVVKNPSSFGILICGSGVGMCISANKIDGIRATLVSDPKVAKLSREHNDANILCLGARFLDTKQATEIARTFLETPFSEDERHQIRVEKISLLEKRK